MVKKFFLLLSVLVILSSTVLASPLTDYAPGKTAVDIHWYPSLSSHLTNNFGYDQSPKGKSGNFDWGITTGLGKKFALQIRQFNPETKSFNFGEIVQMNSLEFNVLYQLNKEVSVFAGYHQSRMDDIYFGSSSSTKQQNTIQFGLTGSKKIADKTHLFGTVGFGNNLTNYEIGIAYEVLPHLELDVLYRYKSIRNCEFGYTTRASAVFKGLGYGITYKF